MDNNVLYLKHIADELHKLNAEIHMHNLKMEKFLKETSNKGKEEDDGK